MKQIEDLAMAAVGFNSVRGDRLSVQNISFTGIAPETGPPSLPERLAPVLQDWMGVIRYLGLAALFFVIYLLVFRPVKRQIIAAFAIERPQLRARVLGRAALGESGTFAPELRAQAGEGDSVGQGLQEELSGINPEVNRTVMLKGRLVEKIKKNPEAASRLIKNWIRQNEARA
jgi:flagellar biosynthesis/type III secretory pathway M-ring protein FliF/YscJ